MTDGTIQFIASHTPKLPSGDYTLTLHETSATMAGGPNVTTSDWVINVDVTKKLQFSILGSRFTLDPQEIEALFPPPGSSGDHVDVLPHVILKRSTLPWERRADQQNTLGVPWLALLAFGENDGLPADCWAQIVAPAAVSLQQLQAGSANLPAFPRLYNQGQAPANAGETCLHLEFGDRPDDSVSVIDVPKSTLASILPAWEDMPLLAHVRQASIPAPKAGAATASANTSLRREESAVVLANRLPDPTGVTVVHLVSLEGRFRLDPATSKTVFDYGAAKNDTDRVRLVSLKSWRFTCLTNLRSFFGLLQRLNHRPLLVIDAGSAADSLKALQVPKNLSDALIKLRPLGANPVVTVKAGGWAIDDGTNHYLVAIEKGSLSVFRRDPVGALRLPASGNADADAYLALGGVPLRHFTRQGDRTVSWYRGPLSPATDVQIDQLSLPARSADALLLYNPDIAMYDVSYAAAWELGRMLTLANKQVSVDLFNWKRAHAMALKDAEQQLLHLSLDSSQPPAQIPENARNWFLDLAVLRGVPFHYLVADEALLPPESLRFFQVETTWVECLIDGAFSIGRVLPSDRSWDAAANLHKAVTVSAGVGRAQVISGFLLRSELVEGYPDLHFQAGSQPDGSGVLPLLRSERPAKNVLLCLYPGQVRSLVLSRNPEGMHFGIHRPNSGSSPWYKYTRNGDGSVSGNSKVVTFRGDTRVVSLIDLAGKLGATNAATFAFQMIEGAESMRFSQAAK